MLCLDQAQDWPRRLVGLAFQQPSEGRAGAQHFPHGADQGLSHLLLVAGRSEQLGKPQQVAGAFTLRV
jgi:hypothetical protein